MNVDADASSTRAWVQRSTLEYPMWVTRKLSALSFCLPVGRGYQYSDRLTNFTQKETFSINL